LGAAATVIAHFISRFVDWDQNRFVGFALSVVLVIVLAHAPIKLFLVENEAKYLLDPALLLICVGAGLLTWWLIGMLGIGRLALVLFGLGFVLELFVLYSLITRTDYSYVDADGINSDAPNILLITADTLRVDHVAAYGNKRIKTPTIDAIAARGTLFENAHSQIGLTNPSHTSILTSRYVCSHGNLTNYYLLEDSVVTLAEILAKSGYSTGAAVSGYPLIGGSSNLNQGFEFYEDELNPLAKYHKLRLVERLVKMGIVEPVDGSGRRIAEKQLMKL